MKTHNASPGTRVVDLDTWPRRAQYELYGGLADPFYDLTVRVPVGDLLARCRAAGWSPFAVVLAGLTAAVNAVEPFRMRRRGEAVVVHEVVHPSWVVLGAEDRLGFARGVAHDDLGEQLASIVALTEQVRAEPHLTEAHGRDALIYASSLAPLDVVAVRGERSGYPDDSVPRFYWGRVVDGRLGLTISAHHGFVDGVHSVRLVEQLSAALGRRLPTR